MRKHRKAREREKSRQRWVVREKEKYLHSFRILGQNCFHPRKGILMKDT